MAGATIQDALKRIGVVEHELAVLKNAFEQLSLRFALYWIDDNKAPAVALKMNVRNSKSDTIADLYVFSENLGKIDLKTDRVQLKPDDLVKQHKWEPLILPLPLLSEVLRLQSGEKEESESPSGLFA